CARPQARNPGPGVLRQDRIYPLLPRPALSEDRQPARRTLVAPVAAQSASRPVYDMNDGTNQKEGIRIRWCGWASNPVGGVSRSRVGSTPAAFRLLGAPPPALDIHCAAGVAVVPSR